MRRNASGSKEVEDRNAFVWDNGWREGRSRSRSGDVEDRDGEVGGDDGPASADPAGTLLGVEWVVEVSSLAFRCRGVWGSAWSLRGSGRPYDVTRDEAEGSSTSLPSFRDWIKR